MGCRIRENQGVEAGVWQHPRPGKVRQGQGMRGETSTTCCHVGLLAGFICWWRTAVVSSGYACVCMCLNDCMWLCQCVSDCVSLYLCAILCVLTYLLSHHLCVSVCVARYLCCVWPTVCESMCEWMFRNPLLALRADMHSSSYLI